MERLVVDRCIFSQFPGLPFLPSQEDTHPFRQQSWLPISGTVHPQAKASDLLACSIEFFD
jgi:hypothetical protein